MKDSVGRVIDVLGTALVLGLLLRWGPEAAGLISAVGDATSAVFRTASLQGIRRPGETSA